MLELAGRMRLTAPLEHIARIYRLMRDTCRSKIVNGLPLPADTSWQHGTSALALLQQNRSIES